MKSKFANESGNPRVAQTGFLEWTQLFYLTVNKVYGIIMPFFGIVPMLHDTKRFSQRFTISHIDCSTRSIWNRSCLPKILIAIVQTSELRPFPNDHIHSNGISCKRIL